MLEIFDKSRKRIAIAENASGVEEERKINSLWYLTFSLPYNDAKNEYCQPFNYVRYNGGELYRIMPVDAEITETGLLTYQCEHVLATLIDNVLFEDCVVDNIHSSGTPIYTSQVNKGESCEMKNVVFRNVTILDGLGCQPSRINVNNTYTSIDFDNLIYNSRKITSFGKEIVLEDTSSEPWEHTWISFK